MRDNRPLIQLIEVLEPLSSEDRRRNINAALTYLGDLGQEQGRAELQPAWACAAHGEHFPPAVANRMQQHGISPDDAVHVFEFREGEPFKILAVPGKGKKPQTLAMYQLVGLATYLETNERRFDDETARQYCKDYGCYDQANHAAYLNDKPAALNGDKKSGWMLTVPGIKIAAGIVKEVAEGAAGS